MTTYTIQSPDSQALTKTRDGIIGQAAALQVVDRESHEQAMELIREHDRFIRTAKAYFEPSRRALDEAKKSVLRLRDILISRAEESRDDLAVKCSFYRVEAFKAARTEEARIAAENREEAEAFGVEPGEHFVAVAPEVARVAGVHEQERWRAEEVDLPTFYRWAVERERWDLLLPCMPPINKHAREARELFSIAGFRSVKVESIVTRS